MNIKINSKKAVQKIKIPMIFVMALISVVAMTLSLDAVKTEQVEPLSKVVFNLYKSLPPLDISHLFIFVFIFYFYNTFYFKEEKMKKSILALSIFFSLSLIFGYSFLKTNSWDLVFNGKIQIMKSIIKFIGYTFIIYILIKEMFNYFRKIANRNNIKENAILDYIFNKHPNIFIPLIILLVWSPMIVIFYPGVIAWDGVTQIKQLLGEYQDVHINIINPNVALNNHHPILSTLLIGLFIQIGKLINNVDLGIYLYILTQLAFLMYVIVYSFKVMSKLQVNNNFKLVAMIFYTLCPIFCIFTLNVIKDVPFSICIFYYVLLLTEMLIDSSVLKSKRYIAKVMLTIFLIMMFRNNGMYTILLTFPWLILILKEYKKRILISVMIPLIVYISLNKIVYPILQISPGSIKEMLSIPFQQTARTLYEKKAYSEEDLEIIDDVLDVNIISEKYNPILSDPVKNTFNKEAPSEMLVKYFKVWLEYLFKYPDTYIEATLNNSYAYLYPNKTNIVGYFNTNYKEFVEENPLGMHLDINQDKRAFLEEIHKVLIKSPVIGTILSAGFYSWMLLTLTVFILLSEKKKFVLVHLTLLTILLVCIASPYFAIRYMLSLVYSLPILIALSIYAAKEE